ncbi:GNAT family N-acetyltransferase [Chryseobacterium carnipullorum]|uniref:GNAT family N-acetyltransferase n=1 Tax=Chryseobacterium carnipullorum TaxID=1124835 RepID=UPI00091D81A5|nr:GNAT family N-acetyltransferase [Chryseobacterium carnipullorum]MDN5423209.1 GNAT family N-acetyltransferase [Chryseobacterium sp.]SHM96086.1 Acetyltransferase (GNAT) family protein [Chryseobacterium carnipullorum]HBV17678.1 N-acetyltransferase [Chryseobacterium carnipullorum]
MEIKKLEKLTENPALKWGLNGYTTDKILSISFVEYSGSFEFVLREKSLSYSKIWETTSDDMDDLNERIQKGHSFGVFEDGELMGWIIGEHRIWNNSFYIENILISEKFRRNGAGAQLIKSTVREARNLNCRIIELETQNTNYPAIQFYRRLGFSITGLNTRMYENPEETAVFMTLDL